MQEIIIKGYDTEVKMPKYMPQEWSTRRPQSIREGAPYSRAEWLLDNIGPGRPGAIVWGEVIKDYHLWYSQVWFGYVSYHFKREADATMFKLKFG